jgi:peptidoglycan/xylan/chitin deacetylase (PgdA/CDA1 family)
VKTYAISEGLAARVVAYARRKGLSEPRAVSALLDAGLRAHERAVLAGKARGATFTATDARAAIRKRWPQ